jgi:hypothetical protein
MTMKHVDRRLPGLQLAIPFEQSRWRTTNLVMAPAELPCRWDVT